MSKKTDAAGMTGRKDYPDGLRKSLLSIGADDKSAEKLVASRDLDVTVIPVYWKDGLVFHVQPFWLSRLPSFLKSFEKEFPDGEVRWDPDYDEHNQQDNSSEVAIRIVFSYQEDDQGDHWSPKPTELELESYQRMLKLVPRDGPKPVSAQSVLHGK